MAENFVYKCIDMFEIFSLKKSIKLTNNVDD